MTFSLSSVFENMQEIPQKYTCEGANISPPLFWANPPQGTESYVLIVDDIDAPDPQAPKMVFVHWLLYNIPKKTLSLGEDVEAKGLPPGTEQGINDYMKPLYKGPCPPIGKHRYFFKLYALSTRLPNLHHPSKLTLEKTMEGSILGMAQIIGLYQKQGNA
jgi:Raf kinase inhibitor-like YbhB/YbcL family protein